MISSLDEFNEQVKSSTGKIVVIWKADWCGPCKAMAPIVEEVAKSNPSVKFVTVDIEGDGIDGILKEYGVRSLPTFTSIDSGSTIKTTTGTLSKRDLSLFFQENGES